MTRKCDFCDKNSIETKIIKTSRFGKEQFFCNTHYYQMVRQGEIKRTYKWKNEIIEHDNHLEILLYDKQNNVIGKAKVSKQHRELVEKYKWGLKHYPDRYTNYVVARDKNSNIIKLHALIAEQLYGKPPKHMTVDHINRDGLDNRDANLIYKDQTYQNYNQKTRKDNTSGVKGVSQDNRGYWYAQIKYKDLVLKKCFKNKEEAIEKRKYWEHLVNNKEIDLLRREK